MALSRKSASPRETLPADELRKLLEREFLKARAIECVMLCRPLPPVFREPEAEDEPNWSVEPPLSCPRSCHRVIEAAVARLASRYDVEPPE